MQWSKNNPYVKRAQMDLLDQSEARQDIDKGKNKKTVKEKDVPKLTPAPGMQQDPSTDSKMPPHLASLSEGKGEAEKDIDSAKKAAYLIGFNVKLARYGLK